MFSLFNSFKTKKIDSHFANMLAVSKLDGVISSEELSYLYKAGVKFGYTKEDVDQFIESDIEIEAVIPTSREQRIEEVLDMLELIAVDKHVNEEELDFVASFAKKLGAKSEFTEIMVRKMAMEMTQNKTREEAKASILPFLVF